MSHHYGRHGPHAWLRRRKRLYRPSLLPVPARPVIADLALTDPGVTIVRIHLPANVERVIFIMIGNPNDDNEEKRQEMQIITNQPADVVPSSLPDTEKMPKVVSSDNPIIGIAEFQAIDDAEHIRDLHRVGKFVVINWVRAGDGASSLARRDVRAYYQRSGQGTTDDYRRSLDVYRTTYLTQLNKEIGGAQERIRYLVSPQEVHLRDAAIQDKQTFSSYDDNLVRDLAVIRVLAEFGIGVERAADRLQDLHPYIEKYQSYFINPREEVVWPDQGFRP